MLSKEYLAGFFDGEGCILISHRSGRKGRHSTHCLRVCISQATIYPLDQIKEQYKGNIQKRKNGMFHWKCEDRQALKFLEDIYPFLICKKDEAELAFEFYKTKVGFQGRGPLPTNVYNLREEFKLKLSEAKRAKRA